MKIFCGPFWKEQYVGIAAGGFLGMYCGARLQKFVPQKYIKLMLGLLIIYVAARYIIQYVVK
jgi:uncharacterized membrane protein YfcA